MARKIFYNRRSRRRLVMATGVVTSGLILFFAGVYTGKSYPTMFSASRFLNSDTAPVEVAAAEF
ncbi:MAG: hypothetical protein RH982_10710 [Parvibaculum sp.]